MTALELRTSGRDGGLEVSVIGPLTRQTSGAVREHLCHLVDTSHGADLTLDLRCCSDVDVDGLLALEVARAVARRHGGDLRITGTPPLVERVFHQHHLAHLIENTGARGSEGDPYRETPEADTLEQRLPVSGADDLESTAWPEDRPGTPLEADPVDVDEQRRAVPLDDEYRD